MALNLTKGSSSQLSLNRFCVGLGWDVNKDASSNHDFDLDVAAS